MIRPNRRRPDKTDLASIQQRAIDFGSGAKCQNIRLPHIIKFDITAFQNPRLTQSTKGLHGKWHIRCTDDFQGHSSPIKIKQPSRIF